MLISRWRAVARASIRCDRLKQTMSSSRPEPASSASSGVRSGARMSETPPAPGSSAMRTLGGIARAGRRRVVGQEPLQDDVHVGLGRGQGNTGPQPADHQQPAAIVARPASPSRATAGRLHGRRHPEIGGPFHPGAGKARRSHAHDGVGRAVDGQHRAHHRRLAAEPALPVVVAQHHHRVGPGRRVVVASEQAPAVGRQPQHLEVVGADRPAEGEIAASLPRHPLAACTTEATSPACWAARSWKRLVLRAQPLEQRIREQLQPARLERPAKRPLGRVGEHHQLLGRGHRQRPQQGGVDQAEDGGVGADAQRQRQHHRQREARDCGAGPARRSAGPAPASPAEWPTRPARTSSFTCSIPPSSSRAWRRASAGSAPRSMAAATSRSRWARSSSSSSRSTRRPAEQVSPETDAGGWAGAWWPPCRTELGPLGRAQRPGHGQGDALPVLGLLLPAGARPPSSAGSTWPAACSPIRPRTTDSQPASSMRWSAGNSEPGFTWNVPRVICSIRLDTPRPCSGSSDSAFSTSRSSVPCSRSDSLVVVLLSTF